MTMLFVLMNLALANPYMAELAIPQAYPAGHASGGLVGYARAIMAADMPDTSVPSTDARIRCAIEDGVLVVKFQANQVNWPTSLPFDATCVHGGEELVVRLVAMNSAIVGPMQNHTLVNGSTISMTKIVGSQWLQSFDLPPGQYVAGNYTSPNMTATRCIVSNLAGGKSIVQLRSGSLAGASSGNCTIPRTGQAPLVLNLQVFEAPI
jgi:hypothetical protein